MLHVLRFVTCCIVGVGRLVGKDFGGSAYLYLRDGTSSWRLHLTHSFDFSRTRPPLALEDAPLLVGFDYK